MVPKPKFDCCEIVGATGVTVSATALLGVLQRGNSLPVSDLGVGAGVEEDGHNLLITPRSVAQNHCLE